MKMCFFFLWVIISCMYILLAFVWKSFYFIRIHAVTGVGSWWLLKKEQLTAVPCNSFVSFSFFFFSLSFGDQMEDINYWRGGCLILLQYIVRSLLKTTRKKKKRQRQRVNLKDKRKRDNSACPLKRKEKFEVFLDLLSMCFTVPQHWDVVCLPFSS
ncbi:hypothetical protein QBC44DRAFT_129574 [Cladorrhinum sp. PSN332]|nr:hypothetical protein QBC44DRAFT_129574 [Cladorrhinum sp. PSN332]